MAAGLDKVALYAEIDAKFPTTPLNKVRSADANALCKAIVDSVFIRIDDSELLTAYLPKDGSEEMAGNLNLAGFELLLSLISGDENKIYVDGSGNIVIHSDNANVIIPNSLIIENSLDLKGSDLKYENNGNPAKLRPTTLTASRIYTLPDKSMTVAGTDDIATAIAALLDSSPSTLDTLNELAAALGDDPNFATTITGLIATKASLSGFTMAGNITMGGYQLIAQYLKTVSDELQLVNSGDFAAVLNIAALTANRNIVFQNKDHTIAGLDDIKNPVVAKITTPGSHTGNTVETIIGYDLINGGTISDSDILELYAQTSKGTTLASSTISVYFNTSASLIGAVKVAVFSSNSWQKSLERNLMYKSGNILSLWGASTSKSESNGSGNQSVGNRTFSVNFSVDQYFIITTTLVDITEVDTLEFAYLKRLLK